MVSKTKVIGADTALRFNRELEGPTIVINRDGPGDQILELIERSQTAEGKERNPVYTCDQIPGDFSSTRLREALIRDDVADAEELCHRADVHWICECRRLGIVGACLKCVVYEYWE